MTTKTLKIALAVSVALNLFAVAGGVTYVVGRDKIERRIEEQRRGGREGPLAEVLAGLDPAVRQRVRASLRETALLARPDFEAARAARREAIAVAGQPTLDAPRVQALLEQSRAYGWVLGVENCVAHDLPKCLAIKLKLTKHVKDLPAKRLARLF